MRRQSMAGLVKRTAREQSEKSVKGRGKAVDGQGRNGSERLHAQTLASPQSRRCSGSKLAGAGLVFGPALTRNS